MGRLTGRHLTIGPSWSLVLAVVVVVIVIFVAKWLAVGMGSLGGNRLCLAMLQLVLVV